MPPIRGEIRFWLNDALVVLAGVEPTRSLLDYLRLDCGLTGSKEGCAEGDCGACTVLIGRLYRGELVYETVNACIRFLPSLDGCHVVTIEAVKARDGGLHPVQRAMVEHHGSQCGFCTPGIVMSLYALWMAHPKPNREQIEIALQGNLCRCTGYLPIIKAMEAIGSYGDPASDWLHAERKKNLERLSELKDGARVVLDSDKGRAILPAGLDDLSHVYLENSEARIISGSTDVGLWVTKHMQTLTNVIYIGHLEELKEISSAQPFVRIGAGASYSEAQEVMISEFPHLDSYWSRIAGQQIRNMGTIGGNIANGSPIGDMPPVLIALGAKLIMRRGWEQRRIPLESFFIEYGKQDRQQGEFIERIRIPFPEPGSYHAAYKISKRKDEDISSVCAAFNLLVEDGVIEKARIAFGGMAAIPKRAENAETSLKGKPFTLASLTSAAQELDKDFTPISDWRASADYRMRVAKNLFHRFWLDQQPDLDKEVAE